MVSGKLPDGWKWTTVENLVISGKGSIKRGPFGSTVKKAYFVPKGYKIYEQQNVINRDFTLGNYYIDESRFRELQSFEIKPGDLLITGAGTIGKVAVVPDNIEPGIINQALLKLSLNREVVNTNFFIYYFEVKLREYLLAQTRGSAMQNISSVRDLKVMEVPLPPLPEQERIVAKIEELFTQLEAGTSALERVRAGLRRYKASVLKAAVDGKLLGNGKVKNGELSEGWRWVTIGEIAEHRLGKMLDKEKNKGNLRPYLRNINVRWFEFDFSDIQEMRVLDDELENISIQKGDLIVCEGGEPGRAAVWNKDETMVIQKALHRVRTNEGVLPAYLMYCLAADANNGKLEKYFTGSTIKHFTGQSLKNYKFTLPSLEEQRRIVAEVERRLSVAREVETTVEEAVMRADRLRQALLKSAFEGRL